MCDCLVEAFGHQAHSPALFWVPIFWAWAFRVTRLKLCAAVQHPRIFSMQTFPLFSSFSSPSKLEFQGISVLEMSGSIFHQQS